MSSQIVTAPDHIPSRGNILIINAYTEQLATLVLWLKTVRDQYTIHVWHQEMPNSIGWAQQVADQAEIILAHKDNSIPKELLAYCGDRIIWFGKNTENHDLIHYFLEKQKLEV
jgi:hypothetical protein